MLTRILLACLFFTGSSSLTCKWMDRGFKPCTEKSLTQLETMKITLTNSTVDDELSDIMAFPNRLYKHASKEPRAERLRFVAHVLNETVTLFKENQTRASWNATTVGVFLDVITQQVHELRSCVGDHNQHKKIHREMKWYFRRLSHVLKEMGHSSDAWELIREQVRLHIYKTFCLAES